MIRNLRSLVELDLNKCSNIGLEDDEVSDLLFSSLKKSCITSLELAHCNILKISSEVGSLKSLEYLDLSGNGFPSLPDSLHQLHELKTIRLSGCANLNSIPYLLPNIEAVIANRCISLIRLPSNMSELECVTTLNLNDCSELGSEGLTKVTRLRNLCNLSMRNCNVSHVPNGIGNLVSLIELDLSGNTFSRLPDSFSNLSQLVDLNMNGCSELRLLPLLPSSLKWIEACGCGSLDVMPFDSVQMNYTFRTKPCKESSPFTQELWITLSGEEEVPEWCSYRNKGDRISFAAPIHLGKKICGIIFCVTLEQFKKWEYMKITTKMHNTTKKTSHIFGTTYCYKWSMSVMFNPLDVTTLVVEAGDTIALQFLVNEDPTLVLSCGLRLIYEDDVEDSAIVLRHVIEPTLPLNVSS